ncbi:hypothetical protein J3459_009660 [Metarhizium acridum]|nr:hypothetical protein J3459_009755 [Metarhizium acridum]KAG8425829.1 hypothetical protein J3459_009660 [Metarhizium acridum]
MTAGLVRLGAWVDAAFTYNGAFWSRFGPSFILGCQAPMLTTHRTTVSDGPRLFVVGQMDISGKFQDICYISCYVYHEKKLQIHNGRRFSFACEAPILRVVST